MSVAKNSLIRWLHISDLHLRDPSSPGNQGDQIDVLSAFLRFCREEMTNIHKFVPDFVFITGDLAYSGTWTHYCGDSEWSVRRFLDELIRVIPDFEKSRLFVVSGNHDVNREKITRADAKYDLELAERARNEAQPAKIWAEIVDRLFPEKKSGYLQPRRARAPP